MKRRVISILLSVALVLTMVPCSMAFGATKAPTDAELEKIFVNMGFAAKAAGGEPEFSKSENVRPSVAYWFLNLNGRLNKYLNEETWFFELTLNQYLNVMDGAFTNYDKDEVIQYLKDCGFYNPEDGNGVRIYPGGLGDVWAWEPLSISKSGDTYTIKGLFLYGNEDTGDVDNSDKQYFDYWKYTRSYTDQDGKVQSETDKMGIEESLSVTVENTTDGLKVSSYQSLPYYTYNGKSYFQNPSTGNFDVCVSLKSDKLTYTAKNLTPTIVAGNKAGKAVKEYDVSYSKATRKAVGRYYATVKVYGTAVKLYFTIVPKAPASASAKLYGYDDVQFSWSKATGASGYSVYYKKANASSYTLLKRTTGTSVKKSNLTDGKKYTFKVVPYYKNNGTRYDSVKYKTASVYTLKEIEDVKAVKSGTKVKVKWDGISGESGYQVYKMTKSGGKYKKANGYTTTASYKSVTATKGKTYYYKVRAYKKVTIDGKTKTIYGPWSDYAKYKR